MPRYKTYLIALVCSLLLYNTNTAMAYVYIKISKQTDQLIIQSKALHNVDIEKKMHCVPDEKGHDCIMKPIPDGYFNLDDETFIKRYNFNGQQVRVEGTFPKQEVGRKLNSSKRVALSVFLNEEQIVDFNNFGQKSQIYVTAEFYCRPMYMELNLAKGKAQLKVSGEYTELPKSYHEYDIVLPFDYEPFTLNYELKKYRLPIGLTTNNNRVRWKYSEIFNKKGETSYHNKDYAQSKIYFLKAVALDNRYIKAYSNLALVYKKQKEISKAIWASEQAIRKADKYGDDKIIAANAYYNLGKIFEEYKDYENALKKYQASDSLNAKEAYKTAIERVKQLQ